MFTRSGARVNTVHKFKVDEIVINEVDITITPSELLKHSRQNIKNDVFYYQGYKEIRNYVLFQPFRPT